MKEWLLSVIGISLLVSLSEIIMPDGNLKKYIKTVSGLLVAFVLILPVINVFNELSTDVEVALDDGNIVSTYNSDEYLVNMLTYNLENNGCTVVSIVLDDNNLKVAINSCNLSDERKEQIISMCSYLFVGKNVNVEFLDA